MFTIETGAVDLQAELEFGGLNRDLTAEEKAKFNDDVWEEKKQWYEGRGVTWGKEPGQCRLNCIKNTERKWWQWREIICPEIEDPAK